MSAASTAEATIVVGVGNPLLGDDGAGWLVADAVETALVGDPRGIVVERLAVGGLTLMEHLVGFGHAILVDTLVTGAVPPGTVRGMTLDALPGHEAGHVDSAHDVTLAAALDAGRALGAAVPDTVEIITIEAVRVLDVGEDLTPEVAAAVPIARDAVLDLLGR
jgi:hydrogenase maturation protease